MLLVKTSVKNSPIAGVGLFADQDIKQGDIVWHYTPETCMVFTQQQFEKLLHSYHKTEKQVIQYYLTYSYYQSRLNGLVFCLDNGRFVNHSETPNLAGPSHFPSDISWQYSVALRDIKKGEELTENYHTYDHSEWLDDLCKRYHIYHEQPTHEYEQLNACSC
ncbi:SET domain-containing protein [Candidatus Protochlamydia phocaeensis]|uniref:SET domain-containing protein n=1 Tax=Candidatus Protochlamydia phocaeensis TaxID=1414722 RepID=UPI000837BFF1|nr:SET domain-containing protein [Candidatus Protochlamydia phocaeensis]